MRSTLQEMLLIELIVKYFRFGVFMFGTMCMCVDVMPKALPNNQEQKALGKIYNEPSIARRNSSFIKLYLNITVNDYFG